MEERALDVEAEAAFIILGVISTGATVEIDVKSQSEKKRYSIV